MNIDIHVEPDRGAIERNKFKEPLGEQIRAELEALIEKYGIVSVRLDTKNHCIEIDIVKLPSCIKPVLTLWGAIYVESEHEAMKEEK